MTSLSAEKPHDMIIGRAKRGQISRTDSEFFNGIGRYQPFKLAVGVGFEPTEGVSLR